MGRTLHHAVTCSLYVIFFGLPSYQSISTLNQLIYDYGCKVMKQVKSICIPNIDLIIIIIIIKSMIPNHKTTADHNAFTF